MARKKKGITALKVLQGLSIAAKGVADSGVLKSFAEGNKTNLPGAEGGITQKKRINQVQNYMDN